MTRHQFFPACPPFVNTVYVFVFVVVVVVVFPSLENYFGFRTTNVRVKTDHPSV